MTNKTNLVHEADAQRHHVRVHLPAQIEIAGVMYDIIDWSTGGARMNAKETGEMKFFSEGKVFDSRLLFAFDGFHLAVPMRIEIRHAKDDKGFIGLRYIDMTQDQIVIMQQLVNSYVTGELTSVGELIHVVGRNNFIKPRQIPNKGETPPRERLVNGLKKLSIPLLSLLLLGYVGTSIYEQKFVIGAESAIVTGDGLSVEVPTGGQISFGQANTGDAVKKGDMLLTVMSDTGVVTSVDSPCDCYIMQRLVESGSGVAKGMPVLRLVRRDAPLFIEAYLPYENALRVTKGQHVHLSFAGKQISMNGYVENLAAKTMDGQTSRVLIRPNGTIPATFVATPATVKINTSTWSDYIRRSFLTSVSEK